MKQRTWILFSALTWLAIGSLLLYKGLKLIAEGILTIHSLSFKLGPVFGGIEQAGTFLIVLGLLIGLVKGRLVLAKTARRLALRISGLSYPVRWFEVYPVSYLFLIGFMILLGISLRFLPIAIDIRGMIDVAIGSALIHGAVCYRRYL